MRSEYIHSHTPHTGDALTVPEVHGIVDRSSAYRGIRCSSSNVGLMKVNPFVRSFIELQIQSRMFKKSSLLSLVRTESRERVREYLDKKRVSKKTFETFVNKEDNPLYVAMIIRKDIEMSQDILKAMEKVKADINRVDEAEQTILHYVCNTFTTDASFVMAVLQYPGINVNATNRDKQTPLHIFCNYFANVQSYKTVLQRFVELHAEIDATNLFHETPLMKTVKNQRLRGLIVQFLIDHGADVTVANRSKNTALHFVVVLNRVDLVNILVKGGADIYCLNNQNESPLGLATKKGSPAVVAKMYEIHNLLQWLSSVSPDYVTLYARKVRTITHASLTHSSCSRRYTRRC